MAKDLPPDITDPGAAFTHAYELSQYTYYGENCESKKPACFTQF